MRNFLTSLIVTITLFAVATVSYSAEDRDRISHSGQKQQTVSVKQSLNDITVEKDEVVIVVHGIVCSFCSQGVRKKLSKLPFIDKSRYQNGVKVEIEKQKVTIAVKPGSSFDISEVFRSIKSGGYEPVVAHQNLNNKLTDVYPKGR